MRVTFCVPHRYGDCEQRDRNWKYVRRFIETHHPDWPIHVGTDRGQPFSPAIARNDAAERAGAWDVAVFLDSDTLVHPQSLREAVRLAYDEGAMVIAGNGKIYADAGSTELFCESGLMFPVPTDWADTRRVNRAEYDPKSVYRDPCSGVVVVPRPVWNATGGYVHSADPTDSFEDLMFLAQCQIFATMTRTAGMQIHLWHPVALRYRGANHRHYRQLQRMRRLPNARALARDYLAGLNHAVPV